MEISGQMADARDIRNAMIYLDKYGIHSNLAMKIYGQYGNDIYNILLVFNDQNGLFSIHR